MRLYQIKLAVKNTKPPVWKRCIVQGNMKFSAFSEVLHTLLGCAYSKNYEFEFYHKKLKITMKQEIEDSYKWKQADSVYMNEILDEEDWFTFRGDFSYECRIDIEERKEGDALEQPEILKEKGEWPRESAPIVEKIKEIEVPKLNTRYATVKGGLLDYGKDDLKAMARELRILHTTALSKDELAEKITNEILIPEVMKNRLSLVGNKAMKAFDEAVQKGECYQPKPEQGKLLEIIGCLGYIAIYTDNMVEVPQEVIEVYRKINTPEFQENRRKNIWMIKCMQLYGKLYGTAPITIAHRMYRRHPEFKVSYEEFVDIFNRIPEDKNPCVIEGNKIIHRVLIEAKQERYIEANQGDKEFYLPSYKEIEDYADHQYMAEEPAYQKLGKFLQQEMKMTKEKALHWLRFIWNRIAMNYDIDDVLEEFNKEGICFESEKSLTIFANFMQEANNHTRMLMNRGYMPCELSRTGISNISIHTIPMMGSMRKEITPMDNRKIYPNDPCPCGSGKKYKKCCGKNR